MLKLVTHILVALALWFALRYFDWHWSVRVTAIVIGAFAVHLVWARFGSDPFLYLGAMPIAADDPLMLEAKRKGKATFEVLRQLYPSHAQDTCVRFALRVKSGNIEHVWGDLLELRDETAKIYLRTPPKEPADLPDRTFEIPVADIDDWQIEMRDGTLRGGFTNQVLFRIFERENGHMHPAFKEQFARFKDA